MTAPSSIDSDALASHLNRLLRPRKYAAPNTVYAARSGISAYLITDSIIFVQTPDLSNPITQLADLPMSESTYSVFSFGQAESTKDLHAVWGNYESTDVTPLTLTRELIEGDSVDWRVLNTSFDGTPVYLDRSLLGIFGRDWSVIAQFAYEWLDGKDGSVRVSGGRGYLTTLGYIMPAKHVSLAGETSQHTRVTSVHNRNEA